MSKVSVAFPLRLSWMDWAATITLVIATVLAVSDFPPGSARWWAALLLLGALIVLQRAEFVPASTPALENARLAGLVLPTVGVALLGGNPLAVIIIAFVLSAHAAFALPGLSGFAWIGGFSVALVVYLAPLYGDWLPGIFNALGTCAGMFFVGAAAHAQKRAEAADAESRRLLDELQDAHRRLQEYAARAEELAVEQERNRLAREVHDTLGHRLTVAAVQLEGAQKLIARDPEKAARMVETVRREVAEGLAELRGTVAVLRAPLDDDLGLAAAVTRLAARFQEATGVAVALDLPPALPPVTPDQRRALYRAVQEALTNVQRHAGARHVTVRFQARAGTLCATVEDDGAGLPADAVGRGYGLRGLRERAEALGGRFAAAPLPGGGTQICFELPLAPVNSEK